MLQSKQVSEVLSQVVTDHTSHTASPISVSLLTSKGLPLTTVTSANALELSLSPDNLRVYSLLAINSFHQQPKSEDANIDDWALIDLDGSLKAMVRKFSTLENDLENFHNDMFVVLFYSEGLLDAQAKVKLDAVTKALVKGLRGYMAH